MFLLVLTIFFYFRRKTGHFHISVSRDAIPIILCFTCGKKIYGKLSKSLIALEPQNVFEKNTVKKLKK